MNDKPALQSKYRVSARLLAAKGSAEPLLKNEARLELANDTLQSETDDEILTQAVLHSTAEALSKRQTEETRRQGAAPLTDLFDPSLEGVVSRHSGQPASVQQEYSETEAVEETDAAPSDIGIAPEYDSFKRTLEHVIGRLANRRKQ